MKVAGRWRYVHRAIDQSGQIIHVSVSPRRDGTAARRFLERAIGTTKILPIKVVTDLTPTYLEVLEDCCRRHGIVLTGMPTTGSRPITVVSRRGYDRCADSGRSTAPES